MSIDLTKLATPFDPAKISWRVGSVSEEKRRGMALAYIDARDVMERLDEVCGPANWQCKYSHAGTKTICDLGICIDGEWVWKANGAGDSDFEAEKGAVSDAFKRAAVLWGVGRYLYSLNTPWVEVEKKGRTWVISDKNDPAFARALGVKQPANVPPSNTGTGQRKPDEPRTPEAELDHAQEHVALTNLVRNQKSKENLDALLATDRFQAFKEVAPFLAGQLRAEIKGQYRAIEAGKLVGGA